MEHEKSGGNYITNNYRKLDVKNLSIHCMCPLVLLQTRLSCYSNYLTLTIKIKVTGNYIGT